MSKEQPRRLELTDETLVPLLLFIGLAALACITPAQNDTWWHLRSGREMWESGSLLTTERFSHTAFGADFRNYWWLSQLAFYALFALGGPVLLTVFAGSCAFAAVAGSWRLMRGPWEIRLVLLLFLIVATTPEWSVRPQVVSLLLMVATMYLVVRDRSAWLPLVCVVWANAHPQVVFGVLMACIASLEALIWSRARLVRDTLIAVGCAAALMVSPDGWRYWSETLSTVSISRAVQLQEYRPPLDASSIPFWIAAAALVVMTFRKRASLSACGRSDRILLLSAIALATACLGAARNIAFFAVVAAPPLSYLSSRPEPVRLRPRPRVGAAAYVMAVLATSAAVTGVWMRWSDGGVQLGWRPMSDSIVNAVHNCSGRLFNHLEDGGYLMWALPSRRVFIDSRMNAYPLELLQRSRDADLYGNYTDLFRDYGIGCAVVSKESPLEQRLTLDRTMRPVYADRERAVFQRAER
jgi:hypothetical protein